MLRREEARRTSVYLLLGNDENAVSGSTAAQYRLRRDQHTKLIADGSITVVDGVAMVTRDIVLSSPSAAGAVVQGQASANGRVAWVTADGQTFGAWESRGVE